MLLGNGSVLLKSPLRFMAGSTTTVEPQMRMNWNQAGRNRNRFYRDMTSAAMPKYAVPSGYYPSYTWLIPQTAGEIASRNNIVGAGTETSANLAGGVNGGAGLTGSGGITSAVGQLVISMVSGLTGSGTVSNADLKAYLLAVADLSGGGSITAAAIGALAWANASVTGTGDITSATPYASGELSSDIKGYSDLTPEGISDKVWAAIIEAGLTAGDIQRLLLSFAAGNATGLEGSSPEFKAQDGTTTRIAGTYSGGTRTVTTVDGA